MSSIQPWGRKESLIWPPRGFYYTYGALFLAVVVTGFLLYIHFHFSLSPLEQYYLPYYLRTEAASLMRPTGMYQLVYIADGKSHSRLAMAADVSTAKTQQLSSGALPLALSDSALQNGFRYVFRELPHPYQNKELHIWLSHWIYADTSLSGLFAVPFDCGLMALVLQLPFAVRKDIRRRRELRYGRRLKGPVLATPRQFTKAVGGDGIGIITNGDKRPLRIPRNAENKHFLLVGDTGSGKSSIIRQMLDQLAARGDSAIIYDPACEFVKQFYNDKRGDIVLNPLDARMPYWTPSEELRRKAEAKALAVSLYQPEGPTNNFFVEAAQKIFAHLLTYLPTPSELVAWIGDPSEIDRRVKGSEHWVLIDTRAAHQRTGVLGSLNMIADSFRLLPSKDDATVTWTATKWAKTRQGWIFITSEPTLRQVLRPLISLWIDLLILRLLNEPMPQQKPVWFVIDDLASLQRLPQLHTAITESRKSQNPVILGFQGRCQIEARYGEEAEAMFSQPATKIFLRTTEPRAAKWVSEAIGEVEVERLRETHYEGTRPGKHFALDRQTEPLVMPSEISGLDDLRGFLKHGNHVARFSVPLVALEERNSGFIERPIDDLIVPGKQIPPEPIPEPVHALVPDHIARATAFRFDESAKEGSS